MRGALQLYSRQQQQHSIVIVKLFTKQRDHFGTALLNAINGDAQQTGYLSAAQSLFIAEVEQLTVLVGQLTDGSMQSVKGFLLDDGSREFLLVIFLQLIEIILVTPHLS